MAMILHKDGLIQLDYDVWSDILRVKWPDITAFIKLEVQYSFKLLIDNVRHCDVKRLLIDSRHNTVEIPDVEYKGLMWQFSQDLLATRLQKVARIVSTDVARENKVKAVSEEIKAQLTMTLQSQNFENEADALVWLKG